jgi:hypothetical protein
MLDWSAIHSGLCFQRAERTENGMCADFSINLDANIVPHAVI